MQQYLMPLKRTALLAIFLSPFLYVLHYVQEHYGLEKNRKFEVLQGKIQPFSLPLSEGETGLTEKDFGNRVSIIVYIPNSPTEAVEKRNAEFLSQWVEAQLNKKMINLKASKTIKSNPVGLWLLRDTEEKAMGLWKIFPKFAGKSSKETLEQIFGDGFQFPKREGGWGIVLNHRLRIKALFPLSPLPFQDLESLLSQVSFTYYMDDYLSKRTFFGPIKEG